MNSRHSDECPLRDRAAAFGGDARLETPRAAWARMDNNMRQIAVDIPWDRQHRPRWGHRNWTRSLRTHSTDLIDQPVKYRVG